MRSLQAQGGQTERQWRCLLLGVGSSVNTDRADSARTVERSAIRKLRRRLLAASW